MDTKPTIQSFNGLTPAEAERLAILAEEMAEVQQVIGKILRHGYESYHPDNPEVTNRQLLEKEIGDTSWILRFMQDHGDFETEEIVRHSINKSMKIDRYLHHNNTSGSGDTMITDEGDRMAIAEHPGFQHMDVLKLKDNHLYKGFSHEKEYTVHKEVTGELYIKDDEGDRIVLQHGVTLNFIKVCSMVPASASIKFSQGGPEMGDIYNIRAEVHHFKENHPYILTTEPGEEGVTLTDDEGEQRPFTFEELDAFFQKVGWVDLTRDLPEDVDLETRV